MKLHVFLPAVLLSLGCTDLDPTCPGHNRLCGYDFEDVDSCGSWERTPVPAAPQTERPRWVASQDP